MATWLLKLSPSSKIEKVGWLGSGRGEMMGEEDFSGESVLSSTSEVERGMFQFPFVT